MFWQSLSYPSVACAAAFTGSYCHVLIAKTAAPMALLTMCDSSDEEIVDVFHLCRWYCQDLGSDEDDKEDPSAECFTATSNDSMSVSGRRHSQRKQTKTACQCLVEGMASENKQ